MSRFLDEIREQLESERSRKSLTHYAFSCGSFFPGEPSFIAMSPSEETYYDLASLTKALVITPLFLREFEEGKAHEQMTLGEFLSEGATPLSLELQSLSIGSLLEHSSGLPAWQNFWVHCGPSPSGGGTSREELIRRLNFASKQIHRERGYLYSDVGYILLGLALETKYGQSLDKLFYSFSKETLGFCDPPLLFAFQCPEPSCVPTAYCSLRERNLKGEVHDENAYFLGGVSGHAGLFGEPQGVSSFLKKLTQWAGSSRIFRAKAHLKEASCGWRVKHFGGQLAFGHLGFTGCGFYYFPENASFLILLANRVISGRTSRSFQKVRERVFQLGREHLNNEINKKR